MTERDLTGQCTGDRYLLTIADKYFKNIAKFLNLEQKLSEYITIIYTATIYFIRDRSLLLSLALLDSITR
jgi:hypothetical protein